MSKKELELIEELIKAYINLKLFVDHQSQVDIAKDIKEIKEELLKKCRS